MEDFNERIGDDPKMMAQVIAAGRLTDVHTHKHRHHKNIATYIYVANDESVIVLFPQGSLIMSFDADLRPSVLENNLITEDILWIYLLYHCY